MSSSSKNRKCGYLVVWSFLTFLCQASATTRYVNWSGLSPVPPYLSWETGARTLQPAIDASVAGDVIMVSDGTWLISSEISVTKAITIQSVSGADGTILQGSGGVRIFNLSNVACVIQGFTITKGNADFGGGVNCASDAPLLIACKINDNVGFYGGGLFGGTVNHSVISGNRAAIGGGMAAGIAGNCLIVSNSASSEGGGTNGTTANNCTIVRNSAPAAGGMKAGIANNCIVYYNSANSGGVDLDETDASYTCSLGRSDGGNIRDAPLFRDLSGGDYRLYSVSPCVDAGDDSTAVGRFDLDGNPRILYGGLDMGAYEFSTSTYFVSLTGSNEPPYAHPDTAAHTIQSAVDLASDGQTVVVDDGIYAIASEILVTRDLTVESVNGPESTVVDGGFASRCFNLGATASTIRGFTIRNGYGEDESFNPLDGGGVFSGSSASLVADCIITNNQGFLGGGIRGGRAEDCVISGNVSENGGGLHGAFALRCAITGNTAVNGGGMMASTADLCRITNNRSDYDGGGIYGGSATNSVIGGNSAEHDGGGIFRGKAGNCTIRGNSSQGTGGGCYESNLGNTIVWYNSASNQDNIGRDIPELTGATEDHCCSPDVANGQNGNTNAEPGFLGLYRLAYDSPCINQGENGDVGPVDLDGFSRVVEGAVDMGAYEYDADRYDSDSDSSSDGDEYIAGTDPMDGASRLAFSSYLPRPEGFVVEWSPIAGRVYSILWANDPAADFQIIASGLDSDQSSFTDTLHNSETRGFYRLNVKIAE